MPNVVMIVEVEQKALGVLLSGLGGRHAPIRLNLEEKVDGDAPGQRHEEDEAERQKVDSFAGPKLHDDVKGEVKHQIADEDGDEVSRKIVQKEKTVSDERPIDGIADHDEEKSVGIRGAMASEHIHPDHAPDSLECSSVELPPAHVVDLSGQGQRGEDVAGGVDGVESRGAVKDAEKRQQDENGEGEQGGVRTGVDIRMPRLIDFEHLQTSQHVHVRGVELKVCLVRANVITGGHDSFHDESEAQGV